VEELFEVGVLSVGNIGKVVKLDVVSSKTRLDLFVPAAVLVVDLLACTLGDGGKFGLRGHPVRSEGDMMCLNLLLETGHTDLKELIQIRTDDAEELQTLKEWILLIERLFEHALVELQPT
jgi:hypothetical protein